MARTIIAMLVAMTCLAESAHTYGADVIDQMLAKEAPKLQQKLGRGGFRSVAVLPFRLRAPETGVSLKGAVVQTNFAAKLERALATYYNPERPVQVVFDAWSQLNQGSSDVDFTSASGRQQLFDREFKLPVGSEAVKVDAFLTGIIEPSADYSTTTIRFELFSKASPERLMTTNPPTVVTTDRHLLMNLGRGFSVPREKIAARSVSNDDIMDASAEDTDWVLEGGDEIQIVEKLKDRTRLPNRDVWNSSPVKITFLYDGQPQQLYLDTRGGLANATLQDPKQGQKVSFEVENLTDEVLGLVLAVNGINTLYAGDATEPSSASKWVLEPRRTYRIQGFYKDLKTLIPITGSSDERSQSFLESGYVNPHLAGLIHATVFQQVSQFDGVEYGDGVGSRQSSGSEENAKQLDRGKDEKLTNLDDSQGGSNQGGNLDIRSDSSELTGFDLALVRGGETIRATGSFHPRANTKHATSWRDLQKRLVNNASVAAKSRGLMIPSESTEKANLKTRKLKRTEVVSAFVIRYYSVVQTEISTLASK